MSVLLIKQQAAASVGLHHEYRSERVISPSNAAALDTMESTRDRLDKLAFHCEHHTIDGQREWPRITVAEAKDLLKKVFSRYKKDCPELVVLTDAVCMKRGKKNVAGLYSYRENRIYIFPKYMRQNVVLHEAAHALTPMYAPSHGRAFRKKRDVLLKRHAKFTPAPVPEWAEDVMHKLEVQVNRERFGLPELYSAEDLWQLAERKMWEEDHESYLEQAREDWKKHEALMAKWAKKDAERARRRQEDDRRWQETKRRWAEKDAERARRGDSGSR